MSPKYQNTSVFKYHCTIEFVCMYRITISTAKTGNFFEYNLHIFKVRLWPSKKNICFNDSPSKMMKNAFYLILKALFVLKILKFLSWFLGHVEKTVWLERQGCIWNLWRHSLVNKELQYIYYSRSHELKETRQWNLVS